jgi:hypothetical protein
MLTTLVLATRSIRYNINTPTSLVVVRVQIESSTLACQDFILSEPYIRNKGHTCNLVDQEWKSV